MANLTSTLLSHNDMEVILTAVKGYIDAEVTKANGDTSAVADQVNTLIGAVEGDDTKSVRAISAEEVAKIVANAPEAFDTLKEIADWIGSGDVASTTAAEMLTSINANAKAISDEAERATGVEEGLDERIGDLEALFEGDNSVDKKIAAAQKAAEDHSDANLQTAKDYTDTEVGNLSDSAVSSTETSGPVTVTLGGTVGAPTIDVAVTMATADEVKALTDMFAVTSNDGE